MRIGHVGSNGANMTHHSRVRGGADSWLNVLPSEFAALDAGLAAEINGVDGGCYAPSSAIILGGSGLQLTGPLVVARGGSLMSQTAGGWSLQDGDFPQYAVGHVGRTRKWLQPCMLARVVPHAAAYVRWTDAGLQSIAPTIDQSDGRGPLPVRMYVPIRAHNGSTLGKVTVNYRVGWPHTALPTTMPQFRVIRKDGGGKAVTLTSSASGADANGYLAIPTPVGAAAWYQGGAAQAFVIVCDQNNVIDVSQYEYLLEITEESGLTGWPWSLVYKKAVKYATIGSNIGSLSTLFAIDGALAVGEGDRVLVKDQTDPTYNGVWIAHAGAWHRATDFQSAADWSRGVVIPIDAGNANGGSYWQSASTITSWTPGTTPAGTAAWAPATSYPVGSRVTPTATHASGFWFLATLISGTGTSGASDPNWPNSVGSTVVDNAGANQIVWTCVGPTATALSFVPRGQSDTDTPGSSNTWFYAHGNIWQALLCEFDNISDTRWA
jgi:hypothetical protein